MIDLAIELKPLHLIISSSPQYYAIIDEYRATP